MAKVPAYNVDKSPSKYDDYRFTLPELYRDIAKEELREDDETRERSLAEMRLWIANNPHIRKCRTDAKFLLRFLRFREFSVPMACEALERYLMMRAIYPSWFTGLDSNDPALKELYKQGSVSILGQDSAGRTVVFFRNDRIDADKLAPPAGGRFLSLLLESMLEWEEVQIGGLMIMIDYSDLNLEVFERWGSSNLCTVTNAYTRLYPVRYNDTYAAKLPKKAIPIIEKMLSFVNPKMRERINCLATVAEMQKHFESSMAPKGYGGQVDLDEFNQTMWKRIEQQRDVVRGLDQLEIDLDYYAPMWDEMTATMPVGLLSA